MKLVQRPDLTIPGDMPLRRSPMAGAMAGPEGWKFAEPQMQGDAHGSQ